MRVCPNCARENSDDQAFCQECGEYLTWELTGSLPDVSEKVVGGISPEAEQMGEPRTCPNCTFDNGQGVDFCENCGEYLRWEITGSLPRIKSGAR